MTSALLISSLSSESFTVIFFLFMILNFNKINLKRFHIIVLGNKKVNQIGKIIPKLVKNKIISLKFYDLNYFTFYY
jgi:hypothetical protein